jgi:uncharacterized membrane-anchored protein YhcB (DUF1043 family)
MTDERDERDERFEAVMRDAKKTFRTPPVPDFDAMWNSIEAAHFGGATGTTHLRERPRTSRWPAMQWLAIAATLVVGVGIGRLSARFDHTAPTAQPVITAALPADAATRPDSGMARPYELETSQYLGQTAALLVSLPAEGRTSDPRFAEHASDLLTRTRLLMDSPAANDPSMRSLLDDLELVLMQVVRLQGNGSRTELDLINRALEQRDVIPRLRLAAADISAN